MMAPDKAESPAVELRPEELARRKWLDPLSDQKFVRQAVLLSDESDSEGLLESIARLTDVLFDDLSVLEHFPEVTSRGAHANLSSRRVDTQAVRAKLFRAQEELSSAREEVAALRESFVKDQIQNVSIPALEPAKLHIGSGRSIIPGWINVDAGGGDVALNLNWGLPFADASVEFVVAAHVLEHLRHGDQAPLLVREIHRLLSPGGVVRFVVPDIARLLEAFVHQDIAFFEERQQFYPLSSGFLERGIPTLEYILLFCGASAQTLNYNHKFGYDSNTLSRLLVSAGFLTVTRSHYQGSAHPHLRVDNYGYNAATSAGTGDHFSLFIEGTK